MVFVNYVSESVQGNLNNQTQVNIFDPIQDMVQKTLSERSVTQKVW